MAAEYYRRRIMCFCLDFYYWVFLLVLLNIYSRSSIEKTSWFLFHYVHRTYIQTHRVNWNLMRAPLQTRLCGHYNIFFSFLHFFLCATKKHKTKLLEIFQYFLLKYACLLRAYRFYRQYLTPFTAYTWRRTRGKIYSSNKYLFILLSVSTYYTDGETRIGRTLF